MERIGDREAEKEDLVKGKTGRKRETEDRRNKHKSKRKRKKRRRK